MSAAAALVRAEAAGVWLTLDEAGRVRMRAASPPPAEVVAGLRQHREALVALLVERRRAAFLARAATGAAEALTAPDPGLARERAVMADVVAAKARGEFGRTFDDEAHRRHVAGLLDSALQRPPAWSDQASRPTPSCHCSCCWGQHWWAPERPSLDGIGPSPGWRCATCHPPPPGVGGLVMVKT